MKLKLTILSLLVAYFAAAQLPDDDKRSMDSVAAEMCHCYASLMDTFDPKVKVFVMAGLSGDQDAKTQLQQHLQTLDSLERKKLISAINENILKKNSKMEVCFTEVAIKYKSRFSDDQPFVAEKARYLEEMIQLSGDCKYLYQLMMRGRAIK